MAHSANLNQSVELPNLSGGQGGRFDQNAGLRILDDCRDSQRALDHVEASLQTLQRTQRSYISGTGATSDQVDALAADIMRTYRTLADQVKRIKSRPEAGLRQNAPQVGSLDRRIKQAIVSFRQQESTFRKEVQEQQRRHYLIVNPNATELELQALSEAGGDTQIFQQALMSADRRGQGQSTLRNVQHRHQAIQQIERDMAELAKLFEEIDTIVVQQDPMIHAVEKHTEDVQQHMVGANVQLGKATLLARAARRKKWICLGIVILILLIVAAIVLIVGHHFHWFH